MFQWCQFTTFFSDTTGGHRTEIYHLYFYVNCLEYLSVTAQGTTELFIPFFFRDCWKYFSYLLLHATVCRNSKSYSRRRWSHGWVFGMSMSQ